MHGCQLLHKSMEKRYESQMDPKEWLLTQGRGREATITTATASHPKTNGKSNERKESTCDHDEGKSKYAMTLDRTGLQELGGIMQNFGNHHGENDHDPYFFSAEPLPRTFVERTPRGCVDAAAQEERLRRHRNQEPLIMPLQKHLHHRYHHHDH